MEKKLVMKNEQTYVNGVLKTIVYYNKDNKMTYHKENILDAKNNIIEERLTDHGKEHFKKFKYNKENRLVHIEDDKGLNVKIFYTTSGLISRMEGTGNFKSIDVYGPSMSPIIFYKLKVFEDDRAYKTLDFLYHDDLLVMVKSSKGDSIKFEYKDTDEGVIKTIFVNDVKTYVALKDYRGNTLKTFDGDKVITEAIYDENNNCINYTDNENHDCDFKARYDENGNLVFREHDGWKTIMKYDARGNMTYRNENGEYEYFAGYSDSDIMPDLVTMQKDSKGFCIKRILEKKGNEITIKEENAKIGITKLILDDRGNTIFENVIDERTLEETLIERTYDEKNNIKSYSVTNYDLIL